MENLQAILLFSLLGIVLPLAIAWFSSGSDWRTARNTILIWVGIILFILVQSGFDWVFFAILYTIPTIPVIAIALRIWYRLERSDTVAASAGLDRQWRGQFLVSLISPAQWLLLAVLAIGGYLGTYWYEQRDLNARADVLRPFLGLPAGTKFASIQSITSPAKAPRIAAIARFSEPQFKSFLAQLDRASLWEQGPPSYGGAPVEAISPQNFRWRDFPIPIQAGNRFVSWTKLSAAEVRNVQRGRALCVALQRKPGVYPNTPSEGVPLYSASDCSELAKTDRVAVIVLGALDLDTRTLHIITR